MDAEWQYVAERFGQAFDELEQRYDKRALHMNARRALERYAGAHGIRADLLTRGQRREAWTEAVLGRPRAPAERAGE